MLHDTRNLHVYPFYKVIIYFYYIQTKVVEMLPLTAHLKASRSPSPSDKKQEKYTCFTTAIQHCTDVVPKTKKQEIKGVQIGKEEIKQSPFFFFFF